MYSLSLCPLPRHEQERLSTELGLLSYFSIQSYVTRFSGAYGDGITTESTATCQSFPHCHHHLHQTFHLLDIHSLNINGKSSRSVNLMDRHSPITTVLRHLLDSSGHLYYVLQRIHQKPREIPQIELNFTEPAQQAHEHPSNSNDSQLNPF